MLGNTIGVRRRSVNKNDTALVSRLARGVELPFGVAANNVTPSKLQNELVTGGEDKAVIGLWLAWSPECEKNFAALDAAKSAAGESHEDVFIEMGGFRWEVAATGFSLGKGSGPKFRWKISSSGFVVGLQKRESCKDSEAVGNGWLVLGSELLMAVGGVDAAFALAEERLRRIGATIRLHKVSQLDPCADLAGVPVSVFTDAFRSRCCVKRARKSADHSSYESTVHGDGWTDTGLSLGRKILLRIYDKPLEVKNSPGKLAILENLRWGGPQKIASRVEFQLSREALKSFGVDTLPQWREKKASILRYLTEEWFRFTVAPVDRNHTDRAVTSPAWLAVARAFASWTKATPDTGRAFRVKDKPVCNPQALMRQAVGCMIASGVGLRSGVETFDDLFSLAKSSARGFMSTAILKAKCIYRRLSFETSRPAFAFAQVDKNGVVFA